jgi:hypothetical protein
MAADANVVVSIVTVQAITVYLLQKLKAIPAVQAFSRTAVRVLAVMAAAIGAAGIHAAWIGPGELAISGLTLVGVATALWHWGTSFVMQQLIYHGVAKPNQKPASAFPFPSIPGRPGGAMLGTKQP